MNVSMKSQLVAVCLSLGYLLAPGAGVSQEPRRSEGPVRVAERPISPLDQYRRDNTGTVEEHPLMPALRWAKDGIDELRAIKDYTCTFVKRERINGELGDHEYMKMKVRHEPFSVYTGFLAPAKLKGQEAIYIDGKNDGKLLAHPNGLRARLIGTISLAPDSMLAMQGNRYPITEAGLVHLTERLIEIGEADLAHGECDVKYIEGAKINGRICTCIEVLHPERRDHFLFHKARIFVDNELNVPVRYEAYDWPAEAGGEPLLTEEYTYLDLKLNANLTDSDFDTANKSYNFK